MDATDHRSHCFNIVFILCSWSFLPTISQGRPEQLLPFREDTGFVLRRQVRS